MSKYNIIPLKPHKARVMHTCLFCGRKIKSGEKVYYQSDKFLQSLSGKKFCDDCFQKHGQKLLNKKFQEKVSSQKTLSGL